MNYFEPCYGIYTKLKSNNDDVWRVLRKRIYPSIYEAYQAMEDLSETNPNEDYQVREFVSLLTTQPEDFDPKSKMKKSTQVTNQRILIL